jgi:hypothetical protein
LLEGDVSGELVYVNYGRIEDMAQLEQLGVSLKGKKHTFLLCIFTKQFLENSNRFFLL